jgi:integrase/recombinase XerD
MWSTSFLRRDFRISLLSTPHNLSVGCGEVVHFHFPFFFGGSTMFDELFRYPAVMARYCTGPLLQERRTFLAHLMQQGHPRRTLQRTARALARIVKALGLADGHGRAMTLEYVRRGLANQNQLVSVAARWLRFIGRLRQRAAPVTPSATKIRAFAEYMKHEKDLGPATIRSHCLFVARFFRRMHTKADSLRKITPDRIDAAFQGMLDPGGYARTTIHTWAAILRAFFRFAEERGWCRKGLAASICSPRVFSQASLPLGPSWDDVRRLLALTEGNQRHNIRARAMLMLFAVYGLRAGEVSRLRLDDFDWEREVFSVVSSKTRRVRTYPLTRSVGDVILRYLKEVRPRTSHRELFISLNAPIRPVYTSLWRMVARRLRSLHISLPHYGPHVLRHACATRLLASGLSLKEIGDQLGHAVPESTRIYAKVDLAGLRQVADFDLGGVL